MTVDPLDLARRKLRELRIGGGLVGPAESASKHRQDEKSRTVPCHILEGRPVDDEVAASIAPVAPTVTPTSGRTPPAATGAIEIQWAGERGWLAVRDPWGEWHEIRARNAPPGWVAAANEGRR